MCEYLLAFKVLRLVARSGKHGRKIRESRGRIKRRCGDSDLPPGSLDDTRLGSEVQRFRPLPGFTVLFPDPESPDYAREARASACVPRLRSKSTSFVPKGPPDRQARDPNPEPRLRSKNTSFVPKGPPDRQARDPNPEPRLRPKRTDFSGQVGGQVVGQVRCPILRLRRKSPLRRGKPGARSPIPDPRVPDPKSRTPIQVFTIPRSSKNSTGGWFFPCSHMSE